MTNEEILSKIFSNTITTSNGCMEWQGNKNGRGYGYMYTGSTKENPKGCEFIHRAVLIYSGINIPDGYYSCHKCDNPICCNPEHLFVGTASDNMKDAREKGRKPTKQPKIKKRKPVLHGTKNMYSLYKCRCSLCKKANSAYMKTYRNNL